MNSNNHGHTHRIVHSQLQVIIIRWCELVISVCTMNTHTHTHQTGAIVTRKSRIPI